MVSWLALASASGCGGSDDPFRIGIITDCAGGGLFAQESEPAIAGAELPLIQRGATISGGKPSDGLQGAAVAGRPVRFLIGCAEPLNPGSALSQLRWLVEERHVDAVVGPTTEVDPIVARYARGHPGVTFMLASYDQSSTLRFPEPNMYRFELDAAQWSAGLAAYAYNRLGWRRVTSLGEGDPAGWSQPAGFNAEFCSLGGRVQRLWAPGDETHLAGWASQVSARADGVFLDPTFPGTAGFVKAWGRRHHDLARRLVVGWGAANPNNARLRGVIAVSSTPWAKTPAYDHYLSAFSAAFPDQSAGAVSGLTYYDEVEPVLEALQQVHGDTSNRERALQAALAHLHYNGPEGPIHLDDRHQAVGPTYLGRIGDGTIHQIAVVPGVEQTFGGYFTPHSTPPGANSPACVKRTPPPWAVPPTM